MSVVEDLPIAYTVPRMAGAPRGRPDRSGSDFRFVVTAPFMALLAWASVLTRASGQSSIPTIEGHLSTLNSSHYTEPICWEVHGLHEHDCFHAEPLTAETYPLTQEMLERASRRYTTTDLGLHRAFQLARRRGVLKVVVIGGSVTFGYECESPAGLTNRSCAWPRRLQQWFDERIQYFTVEMTNAAVIACNIGWFLHYHLHDVLPVDLEVDLIIVDFGVNDANLKKFGGNLNDVRLEHETLISYVINMMVHMPAILYAESFLPPSQVRRLPRKAGNMAAVHAAAARKYDVPMVSLRDAVWPDLKGTALADRLWGHGVHPDWQVHQLLADVMVYFIQKSYARFLEEHGLRSRPSPQANELPLFETNMGCMVGERSFELDMSKFVRIPPPKQQTESVGCSFSEDTGGEEGGLIGFGNSPQKAIVSFDLPCAGENRVLDIGYLKSSSGMGAVRVTVSGSQTDRGGDSDKDSEGSSVVVIDGLWESRASVLDYAVIPIPHSLDTIRVTFEVLSADTEASYSRFLAGAVGAKSDGVRKYRKFKVLRMQCC